jgi:hypothetical protein
VSDSLSKIPVKITLVNKGEAEGVLDRLTAPLTVEAIVKKLPINSRISPSIGFVSVILNIRRGTEKPVNKVESGAISYWPRGDTLCIYPKDFKPYGPVNRIGKVTKNIEIFQRLSSGTRIIIQKI